MPEVEFNVGSGAWGTPSYAALSAAEQKLANILLERGVNASLGWRGESPLEAATVEGHEEIAELLKKIWGNTDQICHAALRFCRQAKAQAER
jgi:hypothetical protein